MKKVRDIILTSLLLNCLAVSPLARNVCAQEIKKESKVEIYCLSYLVYPRLFYDEENKSKHLQELDTLKFEMKKEAKEYLLYNPGSEYQPRVPIITIRF